MRWDVLVGGVFVLQVFTEVFAQVGCEVFYFFDAVYVGAVGVVPVAGFSVYVAAA